MAVPFVMHRYFNLGVCVMALCVVAAGCANPVCTVAPRTVYHAMDFVQYEAPVENVDILLVVDNSSGMADNQVYMTRALGALLSRLQTPRVDPVTQRPEHLAVRSLHVGVVSTDLGTPGSVVRSCANSDVGDDGLLNPVRNGRALRTHLPWTTAPPGRRAERCTVNPNHFPTFLRFDATATQGATFRDDVVCNAYLSVGGCEIEQPLEAAYRALVVRNPRVQVGNTDPNAGFVRDNAVLSIIVVTDEDDASVRDCRYAEMGVPCAEAVSVYDTTSNAWASNDLNLRFYL